MAQVVVILTSGSSWQIPQDCNKLDSVDCYASGGSGAVVAYGAVNGPTGGGGGAFSRKNNIPVVPLAMLSYGISAGAPGASIGSGSWTNGNAGGDTWVTYQGSYICYAQGGRGGNIGTAGGLGGQASAGIGDVKYSGGRGGNCADYQATGGGGAAGPNGDGVNGTDISSSTSNSSGGYGDAYAGGAGSAGVGAGTVNSTQISGPGGTGTEAGSGYGSGGGSGSAKSLGNPGYYAQSGAGGQFGGGSGGAIGVSSGHSAYSGSTTQGFIIIRYTPVVRVPPFNMPMMGL